MSQTFYQLVQSIQYTQDQPAVHILDFFAKIKRKILLATLQHQTHTKICIQFQDIPRNEIEASIVLLTNLIRNSVDFHGFELEVLKEHQQYYLLFSWVKL